MKQYSLFKQTNSVSEEKNKYATKIEAPIYEPKNKQPHILELFDENKAKRLIKEIKSSNIPEQEKDFLIKSAYRHIVFNYEKIADYYAHATPEMQGFMERSGLVILDFYQAIQYGYVKVCDEIKKQYLDEYEE